MNMHTGNPPQVGPGQPPVPDRETLGPIAGVINKERREAMVHALACAVFDPVAAAALAMAQRLVELYGARLEEIRKEKARLTDLLDGVNDMTRVVSSTRVVRRDVFAVLFTAVVLLAVLVFSTAEVKLPAQLVIVSGLLGLNPENPIDQAFAFGFAMAPLALAFVKVSRHAGLTTDVARSRYARGLYRATGIAFLAWVALFGMNFGPSVLGGVSASDPFSEPTVLESVIGAIHGALLETPRLLLPLQVIASLLLMSNCVAFILVSQRDAVSAAKEVVVRIPEERVFLERRLATLCEDELAFAEKLGAAEGEIEALAAAKEAYVARVVGEVEALRGRAEAARLTAIYAAEGPPTDPRPDHRSLAERYFTIH